MTKPSFNLALVSSTYPSYSPPLWALVSEDVELSAYHASVPLRSISHRKLIISREAVSHAKWGNAHRTNGKSARL
eukprot:6458984-Amphidinium_carterae.2